MCVVSPNQNISFFLYSFNDFLALLFTFTLICVFLTLCSFKLTDAFCDDVMMYLIILHNFSSYITVHSPDVYFLIIALQV